MRKVTVAVAYAYSSSSAPWSLVFFLQIDRPLRYWLSLTVFIWPTKLHYCAFFFPFSRWPWRNILTQPYWYKLSSAIFIQCLPTEEIQLRDRCRLLLQPLLSLLPPRRAWIPSSVRISLSQSPRRPPTGCLSDTTTRSIFSWRRARKPRRRRQTRYIWRYVIVTGSYLLWAPLGCLYVVCTVPSSMRDGGVEGGNTTSLLYQSLSFSLLFEPTQEDLSSIHIWKKINRNAPAASPFAPKTPPCPAPKRAPAPSTSSARKTSSSRTNKNNTTSKSKWTKKNNNKNSCNLLLFLLFIPASLVEVSWVSEWGEGARSIAPTWHIKLGRGRWDFFLIFFVFSSSTCFWSDLIDLLLLS